MSPEEQRMQGQIDRLADAIRTLGERISSQETRQETNHQQNRGDIHRLNNSQQVLLDSLHAGLEKIAEKFGERADEIHSDVVDLRLQFARILGYASGISAISVIIFELAKSWIEKH